MSEDYNHLHEYTEKLEKQLQDRKKKKTRVKTVEATRKKPLQLRPRKRMVWRPRSKSTGGIAVKSVILSPTSVVSESDLD